MEQHRDKWISWRMERKAEKMKKEVSYLDLSDGNINNRTPVLCDGGFRNGRENSESNDQTWDSFFFSFLKELLVLTPSLYFTTVIIYN